VGVGVGVWALVEVGTAVGRGVGTGVGGAGVAVGELTPAFTGGVSLAAAQPSTRIEIATAVATSRGDSRQRRSI
jgi:hypothetical protein